MENIFKTVIATSGATLSYLFGEWTVLINILVAFVVFDYISGVMAAAVEGKNGKQGLSSKIGFKAIPKKIMIFILVAIGHLIDQALGDGHLFRDAIIFFYLSNELLSITENTGRIGLPLPPVVTKAIEVLKGKGEQ